MALPLRPEQLLPNFSSKELGHAASSASAAPCLNCHLDPAKKARWHGEASELNAALDAMLAAAAAKRAAEGEGQGAEGT